MKSEKEVNELLTTTYPQIDIAVKELKGNIKAKDWAKALEWLNAIQIGIVVINVAEGILSDEK